MKDELRHQGFFLGAQTPLGTINYADQACTLPGRRCVMLTGVPSPVQHMALSQLRERLAREGTPCQPVYSPAGPDRLDGLLLPEQELFFLGGQQPIGRLAYACAQHLAMDTGQPPAATAQLKPLLDQQESALAQARLYLRIAAEAAELCRRLVRQGVDESKIRRLAEKICRQELGNTGQGAYQEERFLTGFCGSGQQIVDCSGWAQRIYLLEDAYSCFAPDLLDIIEKTAHRRGYHTILCHCPLAPKTRLEHLFIPELSLGFVTSNHSHAMPVEPCKVMNARRFTDPQQLRRQKEQLLANKHIQRQMLSSACQYLAQAEQAEHEIEQLAFPYPKKLQQLAEQLAHRLWEAVM